MNNKINY